MVEITEVRLSELFQKVDGKRVAVIGDVMLDRYLWGSVVHISPEAPVPVVDVESESARLGGAANVANNIKSLGGEPFLIGVVGTDDHGRTFLRLMEDAGFSTSGIFINRNRPTTVKTRVIVHDQHVVRVDHETRKEIGASLQKQVLTLLRKEIDSVDAIILEDYNKGAIARDSIEQLITLARANNKIITVDPKFDNFFEFRQVTSFKSNRKEVEEVLGVGLTDDASVEKVGRTLLERLQSKSVLLTRGEKGMSLFEEDGRVTHVPTRARNIADVSGAGDTVISTLTIALLGGATFKEAATLANYAGGVVCGEVGVVPIERGALWKTVLGRTDHESSGRNDRSDSG